MKGTVPEVGTFGLSDRWDPEIDSCLPTLHPHGFSHARGLGGLFSFALYCVESEEASGGRPGAEDQKEPATLAGGCCRSSVFRDTDFCKLKFHIS